MPGLLQEINAQERKEPENWPSGLKVERRKGSSEGSRCALGGVVTQTPHAPPYPRGLVSGKHAPRVPVQVPSVGCVLGFSKAVDVPGGKAGGDAEEHVVEREAEELGIPAAARAGIIGGKWAVPLASSS